MKTQRIPIAFGVDPAADKTVRQAWRALVREYHPDQMIARGVQAVNWRKNVLFRPTGLVKS